MAYLNDRQRVNFEAMISPEPNSGCWLWLGYTNRDGYGKFNVGGKIDGAHRVSYREYRGQIPPGYLVLHSCDVASCVNPDHLRLGSDVENAADKAKRRRVHQKISDQQVAEVRAATGRYRDIGEKYKISASLVCRIKSGDARTYARSFK